MRIVFWIATGVALFAVLTFVGFSPVVALLVAGIAVAIGSQAKRAREEFAAGFHSR